MMGVTGSKRAAIDLLHAANVRRVIIVDDDFDADEGDIRAQSVATAMIKATADQRRKLRELDVTLMQRSFDFDGELVDEVELRALLDDGWSTLDGAARAAVMGVLALDVTKCQTRQVHHDLSQLLADEQVKVDPCPLAGWDELRHELCHGASNMDGLVLLLFDRSMGGDTYAGDGLVREVAAWGNEHVIVGLLTGEANTAQGERDVTKELVDGGVLAGAIGKYAVGDDGTLAESLRSFLVLSSLCELRRIVIERLRRTDLIAEGGRNELTFDVLVAMAVAADGEGAGIASGLERTFRRTYDDAVVAGVRKACACSEKVQALYAVLACSLPCDKDRNGKSSRSVALGDVLVRGDDYSAFVSHRQADEYMDGELLLGSRLPIDIGDVFLIDSDVASSSGAYVLLSQQCGLSLRADGTRTGDSTTKFALLHMKPVIGNERTQDAEERSGRRSHILSAPLGLEEKGEEAGDLSHGAYVDFFDRIHVLAKVLDLCVFSNDGSATTDGLQDRPELLERGWRRRAKKLEGWKANCARSFDDLARFLSKPTDDSSQVDMDRLRSIVLRSCFGLTDGSIVATERDGTFSFGIRRIARLRERSASMLLTQYARYQSRPAEPNPIVSTWEED